MIERAIEMERKEVTVLAADVIGYSRLVATDEDLIVTRLQFLLKNEILPSVRKHSGWVVKFLGDGILATFPNPQMAIAASREILDATQDVQKDMPEDTLLRFRVGINHGTVLTNGEDIFGDVVNIAARLESLAPHNGICVSQAVRDLVDDDLPWVSRGKQFVRNIPEPIEIWQFGETETAAAFRPDEDRPAVAVLPFSNDSRNEDDGFLALGVAEDVISQLSRFRSLFVISRASSFAYKDQDLDLRSVGADLGVRYLVRGSLRRAGSRVRVVAELVNAQSSEQIWSERFDRDVEDIFAVQDEITHKVVTGLVPELGRHEREIARKKPTENLSGWEWYQRGTHDALNGNREGYKHFLEAIAVDPNFALAYASLGQWHAFKIIRGRSSNPLKDIKDGFDLATKAISIDDRNELGHATLATLHGIAGQEDEARTYLSTALSLNDNSIDACVTQCYVSMFRKRPDADEMETAARKAIRLSPKDPSVWSFYWMAAQARWIAAGAITPDMRADLNAACNSPNGESFVYLASAVLENEDGNVELAQQRLAHAKRLQPRLSMKYTRTSFHFPIFASLYASMEPALHRLVPLGYPIE